MPRIRFDFGTLSLEAELADTPTAQAVLAKLPYDARVMTWGEEVYFDVPVKLARETGCARRRDAGRGRLLAGRAVHRARLRPHADLQGRRNAAREPVQHFRKLLGDAKALAKVKAGAKVRVRLAD